MPDVNYYFSEKNDLVVYIATNFGLYRIRILLAKQTCDNKLSFIDIRSVFKKDNRLWIFGEKGFMCLMSKN